MYNFGLNTECKLLTGKFDHEEAEYYKGLTQESQVICEKYLSVHIPTLVKLYEEGNLTPDNIPEFTEEELQSFLDIYDKELIHNDPDTFFERFQKVDEITRGIAEAMSYLPQEPSPEAVFLLLTWSTGQLLTKDIFVSSLKMGFDMAAAA